MQTVVLKRMECGTATFSNQEGEKKPKAWEELGRMRVRREGEQGLCGIHQVGNEGFFFFFLL